MLEKFLEAAAITLLLKLLLVIGSLPYVTQGAALSQQIISLIDPNANGEHSREGESYDDKRHDHNLNRNSFSSS